MTFRDRHFTKRNYECTNVVACQAEEAPETSDDRWVASEDALRGLDYLWTERGVSYYGYA